MGPTDIFCTHEGLIIPCKIYEGSKLMPSTTNFVVLKKHAKCMTALTMSAVKSNPFKVFIYAKNNEGSWMYQNK